MKKLLPLLTIFIVISNVILIVAMRKKDYNNNDYMAQAFAGGNFDDAICSAEVSCSFGSIYYTNDEKIKILEGLFDAMGIKDKPSGSTSVDENGMTVYMEKQTDMYGLELKFVTTEHAKGNHVVFLEQYMTVRLSIRNSVESMLYYREIMEDYMKSYGNDTDSRMEFSGSVKGNPNLAEKADIVNNIMKDLGARIMAETKTDDNYYVYGYSKNIDDYVNYGNKKVNVSIRIHYDEKDDATGIYMAVPSMHDEPYKYPEPDSENGKE